MEIIRNKTEFDKRQLGLIQEIIRAIKSDLQDAELPDDVLADLTGDIAFSVAAIIDGSRKMRFDGKPLVPVLTFADDNKRTKLIAAPGGSWMHEYAASVTDEVFDEETA